MGRAVDIVVLLGAPGSGKSTVGARLARDGFRWRDWEVELLRRWGGREGFLARKDEALPVFHDEVRRWIVEDGPPAVFETTGLSDAPLLARLQDEAAAFVVRLDVGEVEALRRIAARPRDRHLTDDPSASRRVVQAFQTHVVPRITPDLVIDTTTHTPAETTTTIRAALADR
ncbi:MAG TPA: hypothetical protein VIL36_06925 [Acidimicrobiales bacterium]